MRTKAKSKTSIGIDLGSRMTKIVWLTDGRIDRASVFETGHNPLERLREAVDGLGDAPTTATGYGRYLANSHLDCPTVTEILACARAARHLDTACDRAIDIGGQDSKAIELSPDGGFERFEMNDRCAAGTGRFLEVMASALGYELEEFGREAMKADVPVAVSSMCTVFAESEVVSLVARGEPRERIALGLHAAIGRRVAAMASRVGGAERTLLVGGVARNPCIRAVLGEELSGELVVPDRPELAVALGAALLAAERQEAAKARAEKGDAT